MEYFDKTKDNLIFYKSKEMPDYYLLYAGLYSKRPEEMLQMLNHTGKFWNSGFPHADVDLAYVLETYDPRELLDFITKHIATNHIAHPKYDGDKCKGWYELKTYEPDKWIKDLDDYRKAKRKNRQPAQQLKLF